MKLNRIDRNDFGGNGSGFKFFEGSHFSVHLMRYGSKNITEIRCRLSGDVNIFIEGRHEIKSDRKCFEQLNITDFRKIIKGVKKSSFEVGADVQARKIRKSLGIYSD